MNITNKLVRGRRGRRGLMVAALIMPQIVQIHAAWRLPTQEAGSTAPSSQVGNGAASTVAREAKLARPDANMDPDVCLTSDSDSDLDGVSLKSPKPSLRPELEPELDSLSDCDVHQAIELPPTPELRPPKQRAQPSKTKHCMENVLPIGGMMHIIDKRDLIFFT